MKDKDTKILHKILEYVDDTANYINELDFDAFLLDKKTISACSFAIMQIGELAKEFSNDIQTQNPAIPWNGIKGMRNRIVHEYKNIDFTVLWDTVKTSLPILKTLLFELLKDQ